MSSGLHLSIAKGLGKVPLEAQKIGCECFQIFSRSPHGGGNKIIDTQVITQFRANHLATGSSHFYIHTPYYINLASSDRKIFYGSVAAVKTELETADLLGARGVVTHIGSAGKNLLTEARQRVVKGLLQIFLENDMKTYRTYKTKLLLEITAGSGKILGSTFEEIAFFISEVEKVLGENVLGVCFDTAHAFASGYDLRTSKTVADTIKQFDALIGWHRVELIHLNDSLAPFNSKVDRHANLGKGEIGLRGLQEFMHSPLLRQKDFVLETPVPDNVLDLGLLKNIRLKK